MARNKDLMEMRNKAVFNRFIQLRMEERRNKKQAIEKLVPEFFISYRTIHNIIFAKKFKAKRRKLAKQANLFEIKQ